MKGKKLTRRMMDFLDKRNINPDGWYYLKNTSTELIISNKDSGETLTFNKEDYDNILF
jgi:hypothetical protein